MDFEDIRLKITNEMKKKVESQGSDAGELVKMLIDISSKVTKNMFEKYHNQISQKG